MNVAVALRQETLPVQMVGRIPDGAHERGVQACAHHDSGDRDDLRELAGGQANTHRRKQRFHGADDSASSQHFDGSLTSQILHHLVESEHGRLLFNDEIAPRSGGIDRLGENHRGEESLGGVL